MAKFAIAKVINLGKFGSGVEKIGVVKLKTFYFYLFLCIHFFTDGVIVFVFVGS